MNANALLSTMDEELAVKALAALAQSSRLRVFRAIVGAGLEGMQPGQLSQTLDIPANTLSFHLKELHHAGLVSVQREGRFLRYCADMPAMQSLVGFLTDHCRDASGSLWTAQRLNIGRSAAKALGACGP
jgi:DNA-binding transcriptional ArsR family regulator